MKKILKQKTEKKNKIKSWKIILEEHTLRGRENNYQDWSHEIENVIMIIVERKFEWNKRKSNENDTIQEFHYTGRTALGWIEESAIIDVSGTFFFLNVHRRTLPLSLTNKEKRKLFFVYFSRVIISSFPLQCYILMLFGPSRGDLEC